MIPQLFHPWLPQKIVWGGLPLEVVLTWLVPDAPFAVEEADAASTNPLLVAHQPATSLLFLKELCRFHGLDAPVADRLAGNVSFAAALAVELVARHAAILQVAGCDRVLAVKSVPCLQRQGRCLMHQ